MFQTESNALKRSKLYFLKAIGIWKTKNNHNKQTRDDFSNSKKQTCSLTRMLPLLTKN